MKYLLKSLTRARTKIDQKREILNIHKPNDPIHNRLASYSIFISTLILEVENDIQLTTPKAIIYNLLSKINKFLSLLSSDPTQALPHLDSVYIAFHTDPPMRARLEPIYEILVDSWNNLFHHTRVEHYVLPVNNIPVPEIIIATTNHDSRQEIAISNEVIIDNIPTTEFIVTRNFSHDSYLSSLTSSSLNYSNIIESVETYEDLMETLMLYRADHHSI